MASTKLIYFAWVRERIGKPDEEIALPAEVRTVNDLLDFLKARGDGYEAALKFPEVIRVAIDQEHVEPRRPDRRRARDRAVPADDGRLALSAHVRPIVRIQAEDFDPGAEIARLTAGAPTSARW